MSDDPPTPAGGDHEAVLYDEPADFVEHVARWVVDGVQCGDQVVVAAPDGRAASLSDHLDLVADDVLFVSADAVFRDVGPMFRRVRSLVRGRDSAGRPLRLAVEHPGVGARSMFSGELREYLHLDALCTATFRDRGVACLCAFPRDALSQEEQEAVVAAHPAVRRNGGVTRDGHLSPAALIADGQRRVGGYTTPADAVCVEVRMPRDLARARDLVRSAAGAHDVSDTGGRLASFLVAVSEIATNALIHGGGGTVAVWVDAGRLICDVRDTGQGVADPLSGYELVAAGAHGGRGLWLARQLTTLLELGRGPDGTLVRLHLAPPPGERSATRRRRAPGTP